MEEDVKDLNRSLVGRLSTDHRQYTSKRKNCVTIITANPDRTLNITHQWAAFT